MIRLFLLASALGFVTFAAKADPTHGAPVTPMEAASAAQGDGWRLTTRDGMTLYVYEADEAFSGQSKCTGECGEMHLPLVAHTVPAELPSDWTVITRADGLKQWAFSGKPVYTYSRDTFPGGTFGEDKTWFVAFKPIPMPPGITLSKTLLGTVLATQTGRTLYTSGAWADGATPKEDCANDCAKAWLPLPAARLIGPVGQFVPVTRSDGVRQWSYRGKLLYTAASDAKSGDTTGDGKDGWKAIVLESAPPLPAWVRVVGSDGGALLAGKDGRTLYAYTAEVNPYVFLRGEFCVNDCVDRYWEPVVAEGEGMAEEDSASTGNWSVIINEKGVKQWAYKGRPLFTSKEESKPGDLTGITRRNTRAWRPIMRYLPSVQGAGPQG